MVSWEVVWCTRDQTRPLNTLQVYLPLNQTRSFLFESRFHKVAQHGLKSKSPAFTVLETRSVGCDITPICSVYMSVPSIHHPFHIFLFYKINHMKNFAALVLIVK